MRNVIRLKSYVTHQHSQRVQVSTTLPSRAMLHDFQHDRTCSDGSHLSTPREHNKGLTLPLIHTDAGLPDWLDVFEQKDCSKMTNGTKTLSQRDLLLK